MKEVLVKTVKSQESQLWKRREGKLHPQPWQSMTHVMGARQCAAGAFLDTGRVARENWKVCNC